MSGRLLGIARKSGYRAPMEELAEAHVSGERGLAGDYRGAKYPRRQITVLAREDFEAALLDLAGPAGPPDLPWTARRANLYVEGVTLPRAAGGVVRIGPLLLEVTGETVPCARMNEAYPGLLKALYRDWRGGITCRVLEGGSIRPGDEVAVLVSPPSRVVRLPG